MQKYGPVRLIGGLILVVLLTSLFGPTLGTDGIFIVVVMVFAVLVFVPIALRGFRRHVVASRGPSRLDWLIAPSGYRANLRLALPQEVSSHVATQSSIIVQREVLSAAHVAPEEQAVSTVVDEPYLDLAADLCPPVHMVIGRAILCIGRRGMGKSTLAGRFIEQMGQHPVPMSIFDYEQDYASLLDVLPRATLGAYPSWREGQRYSKMYGKRMWQVDLSNAEEVGYLLLQEGVQLVLQTSSYPSLEMAAQVMVAIIDGMFAWAEERDPEERVPALIMLDEAQHFIPQSFGSMSIKKAEAFELLRAFQRVNSIGRKRGFTPAIFGTRIAQINNEAIAGSEIYFLMGTTFPNDLQRYRDILGTHHYNQEMIAFLGRGDVLTFEGGNAPFVAHVKERASFHRNITPGLQHAQQRYGVNLPNFGAVAAFVGQEKLATPQEGVFTWPAPAVHLHAESMLREEERVSQVVPTEETSVEVVDEEVADAFLIEALAAYKNGYRKIDELAAKLRTTPYYARQALAILKANGDIEPRRPVRS